jgi:ABC-type Zn uptake system ZnuABC Zn-binding protein ZnuA
MLLAVTPRWFIAVLAVAFAAVFPVACGSSDGTRGSLPGVIATTTQVGDLAREVAGDRAQVRQLLGANSDPHEYEPRPSDVRAISGAAVVLRSGGDLDEWLTGVLRDAASEANVVTLLEAVRTREGERHDDQGAGRLAAGRGS